MWSIFTLLVLGTSQAQNWQSGGDLTNPQDLINNKVYITNSRSENLSPINVFFDVSRLTNAEVLAAVNNAIPLVNNYLRSTIQVFPIVGTLNLNNFNCGGRSYSLGDVAADFYIIFDPNVPACASSSLLCTHGYTRSCHVQSNLKNNAIGGIAYISTDLFRNLKNPYQEWTFILHQAIHLLGFSEALSGYWEGCKDINGNFIKCTSALIKENQNVRKTVPKTFLKSPRVLLETKAAFGNDLIGAELEEWNGIGGANQGLINHWDSRIFPNDVMAARGFHEMIVSTVTLGLLHDTNWYSVNFAMGQTPIWGRQEECPFTGQKCIINKSFSIQHRYWCVKGGQPGCNAMRTQKGVCDFQDCQFSNNEFNYFNANSAGEKFTDYCPVVIPITSGDCRLEANANNNAATQTSKKVEIYGKSSRCFEHNLVTGADRDLALATLCAQVDCSTTPHYTITLKDQNGANKVYNCPEAGGFIRIPEWRDGWVKCWPRLEVCDDAPCCNLCNGRGVCSKGFCQCNDGFSGTCCEFLCEEKCLKCSDKDTCTKCAEGYYLEDGDCKKCKDPCVVCNSATDCTRCTGQEVLYNLVTNTDGKGECKPICPADCKECVKPGTCIVPDDGKCFDINGVIVNCCANCNICSKTRCCECTECKTGYFLTSIGTCTNQCAANCRVCATIYDCATCQPGFILNEDKKCIRCPPNCAICDDTCPSTCNEASGPATCDPANCFDTCPTCTTAVCTTCNSGYTRASTGECIRNCPQNCRTCSSATVCTYCNGGFALKDGQCVACEIGCISCLLVVGDNTKTNCQRCYCGYYLGYRDGNPNDGDCINCMPGCVSCSSHQTCDICTIRWWLDFNGNSGCKRCEYGCKRCLDLFSCIEPEIGYYLCEDCISPVRCHKSCYECGSDLICKSCIAGYFFYECTSSNCLCRYCEPNCARCSGPIECVVCRCGYYLAGVNECRPCHPTCYSCDRLGVCSTCRGGYFLNAVSRLCECCPLGCVSCISAQICRCCAAGWWPDEYVCKPCPFRCSLCWTETDCYACVTGWWLDKCSTCLIPVPVCKQCDPKCIRCDSLIDCNVCRSNYFLRQGICLSCGSYCSICQDENLCTICNRGYYLGADRKCYKCNPGCVDCCDENTCLLAACGYFLVNFPLPNTQNLGVRADPCDPYCRMCTGIGKCTLAQGGYYLEDGYPKQCPPTCSLCNNPGYCTKCVNRHYLDNGVCKICDDNCNACDRFGCTTPKSGYYIGVCPYTYRNIPVLCKSPCTTCIGEGEYDCLGCRYSYGWIANPDPLIKSYSCLPCENNCRACGRQPVCTACNPGYYIWRDGAVFRCPELCTGCKAVTDITITVPTAECTSCKTGYGVYLGGCVQCSDTCNKCSNNKCELCKNGYYVTPSGSCAMCTNDCLLCKGTSSSCTACSSGFYLTSNPGSCLRCMTNCIRCTKAETCDCCRSGFFFDIGGEGNPAKCTYCGDGCKKCANQAGCTQAYDSYYIDWSANPPVSRPCKDTTRPYCRLCSQKEAAGVYSVECLACSSSKAKLPFCRT